MTHTLLVTIALISLVAIGHAKSGRPTGDLIAVPKPEFQSRGLTLVAGAVVRNSLAGGRILVIRPAKNQSWKSLAAELRATGNFSSVEPDTWAEPSATPNDPSFSQQWHLFQTSLPRAWDFVMGTNAPILAVVDSGVDLTHPDLVPNLVPGYNTISGLTQTNGGDLSDISSSGHGTRCAGIAGACGNNGIGVSGVGWNLKVMPIRATNLVTGVTTRSELLEGVTWAISNGAKVASVSYTEVEYADVQAAGAFARSSGAHLVWSAGNTNSNWSSFDHTKVTIVGGTDQQDQRWTSGLNGSGYGRAVDIYAPCTQIYTTRKGGQYGFAPAGVSFAVPQVAAALALLHERLPTASPELVEQLLLWRTYDISVPGRDEASGWGRVNTGKAVENPDRRYALALLPRPVGSSWANAVVISDSGAVFGIAGYPDGTHRIVQWQDGDIVRSVLAPAGPYPSQAVAIYDVNSSLMVVGHSYGHGFKFNGMDGTIQSFGPVVYPITRPRAINDQGDIVGYDEQTNVTTAAWSWFAGESERTLLPVPGESAAIDITNHREIYGTCGNGGRDPYLINENGNLQYLPRSFGNNCRVYKGNNSGLAVGFQFNDPWPSGMQATIWDNFAQSDTTLGLGLGTYPAGSEARNMNDFNEVVGTANNSDGAVILQGVAIGHLSQLLTAPHSEFANLTHAGSINNKGQLVGFGTNSGGTQNAFRADPVEHPAVGVGLGQLGAQPTYIGSIPPSLSVTFTTSDGVAIPNSTQLLAYNGTIGRLELEPPPGVMGNYRLYLRCNGTAIPGFIGPTYLNKLYPPLSEPSIPRDAYYVPYNGPDLGEGAPLILMFAGDCDGSGEIDAADIDATVATFGDGDWTPGWTGATDCDGTGEIDAADIDYVVSNFGLTGDPEP
ncbi:MAG: S8 family serine peptidase [Fimbriimonadaceae bacterium]|nr:S8 family serine peptidase [Fimbriimonadaceae bacterium]